MSSENLCSQAQKLLATFVAKPRFQLLAPHRTTNLAPAIKWECSPAFIAVASQARALAALLTRASADAISVMGTCRYKDNGQRISRRQAEGEPGSHHMDQKASMHEQAGQGCMLA